MKTIVYFDSGCPVCAAGARRWLSHRVRAAGLERLFDRAYRWHSRGRFAKRCSSGTCPLPGAGRAS